jgi:hypothetical protein
LLLEICSLKNKTHRIFVILFCIPDVYSFGKSSALYASWIMTLVVVGEFATGKLTDGLWTANNYGSTFTSTDWSRFDPIEEEDEDEEDEDEDDDE